MALLEFAILDYRDYESVEPWRAAPMLQLLDGAVASIVATYDLLCSTSRKLPNVKRVRSLAPKWVALRQPFVCKKRCPVAR